MSNRPDFDVKDRVKQATNIVDLIGTEMNLRRRGNIYYGVCPWHQDNSPSFQVNPVRQSWVCYPCDVRGDVFDYVMRTQGVDFRQALEILAERANITLTTFKPNFVKGSADDKQTLFKAMKWAEEEYHHCLIHSEAAEPVRKYLSDRGISQASIEAFKIGFAPLSWSWLVDRSRDTPYHPDILEACGLVNANNRGGYYERFRGRVLFPIRDTQERPIALGGRVVPGLYGEGEEPKGKYVNSPETRLFSKSKNLYALNMAREDLQKTSNTDKRLTIVEGYTDVVAAWQAGLRNVVAALGVALNEQHIQLIKRFADGITLVLDGDEAGQRTMNTVLDLFVAHDIDLRILSLPEGADPFDFLMENGGDVFQNLVNSAPDAIAHKISVETRGVDIVNDTHRANQALENILKTLAKVPASVIAQSAAKSMRHDQILMRVARQFQLDQKQVRRRLSELRTSLRPSYRGPEEPSEEKVDYTKFNLNEVALIELLIQEPNLLDRAIENIAPSQMEEGVLRELYETMDDFFHEGTDVSYEQLMLELEVPRLKAVVDYLYDRVVDKKQTLEGSGNTFGLDLEAQLDTVIANFNSKIEQSGSLAVISKLHQKVLDENEETSALEELFKQQLQKIKKTK